MHTHHSERTVSTPAAHEFVDITDEVDHALARSGVDAGHVTVSAPPGCSIIVNEFESGLLSDLKRTLLDLQQRANGSATPIGATSVVLPADEGRLCLGRWQRLLLVELESPTERTIGVQVVGD